MYRKNIEFGRSMVEMLGVLAVMGVLSVAGIAGFKNAMDKNRANELLNEANKRATIAAMQFASGRKAASLTEFSGNSIFSGGTFDDTAEIKLENEQFKIPLSNILPGVCTKMQETIGKTTITREIECSPLNTGNGYITFNQDLSSTALCDLNVDLSSGCPCPKHRDKAEGKCGVCLSTEEWISWVQPVLTSQTSYGMVIGGGVGSSSQCTDQASHAWCAFDGSVYKFRKWFIRSLNATIEWHLPVRLKISNMNFVAADVPQYRFPDSVKVYGSNDGAEWIQICSKSFEEKPVEGQSKSIICDDSTEYEYLKWNFSNTDSGNAYRGISLAEIQITAKILKITNYEYDSESHKCIEKNE